MNDQTKFDSRVVATSDIVEGYVPNVAPHTENIPSKAAITRRRAFVLLLNALTIGALFAGMTAFLSYGGLIWIEVAMLAAYAVTLPWLSIGLWNAVIGLLLSVRHGDDAATVVTPALARVDGSEPIRSRVAIVMPLRNEDPDESLTRLRSLQDALSATNYAHFFEYHVLSDTDRAPIALKEEASVAAWRAARPGVNVTYRRRDDNWGYKAGNIAEFLNDHQGQYDFFLPLDADSVMGADAVLRLIRVMEASPEIGMLQSLVTGLPSKTFFTRAFQFGMRHGMRSYTLGAAWWQADCGPNWGHNVLIRAEAFRKNCVLPVLPGKGPLSGYILSHDQLEATLIRRAGYEVRVLAEESDSHEENPPSLADFIRRELRWANGNMQYLRLLGTPGLKPMSRIQLFLAIQMYAAAPAWMAFVGLGALLVLQSATQFTGAPLWMGLSLFAVVLLLNLMPKFMGLVQVLLSNKMSAAYGGRTRVVMSGLVETIVSMLTAPIVAFGLTVFVFGLFFNRRVGWDAQQRSRAYLTWGEASRVLWPQTVAGLALTAWLAYWVPGALIFGAPMLIALVFAIPIAVITTLPSVSKLSIATGLFDIPEDRATVMPEITLAPTPERAADIA
ncbi:MAG: glucans biosynthesis glucosyltransferase MdoH [Pseudomonadota bacterium]